MSDNTLSALEGVGSRFRSVHIWAPDDRINRAKDLWMDFYTEFKLCLEGEQAEIDALAKQHSEDEMQLLTKVLTPGQRVVKCDCEDLKASCNHEVYDELILPAKDIILCAVLTPEGKMQGKKVDHAIAGYRVNGELWHIDNRSREMLFRYKEGPYYNYVEFATFDDPTNWHPWN